MSYWAVVQAEPKRERIARLLLMRKNYETYAPRIKVKSGKASKIALLFPSYIFVRIEARWYPVLWTPGVLRVLMSGEVPAHVPDKVVVSIRKREGRDGLVRLPRAPGFYRGQPMTITRGSFTGHLAIFEGMTGSERSKVLVNLLGGLVEVEMEADALRANDLST